MNTKINVIIIIIIISYNRPTQKFHSTRFCHVFPTQLTCKRVNSFIQTLNKVAFCCATFTYNEYSMGHNYVNDMLYASKHEQLQRL